MLNIWAHEQQVGAPALVAARVAALVASKGGALYDPADLTSLFQEAGGSTPSVADGPVGRVNDLSGNGNHLLLTGADGSRPTLRTDGGLYWLEYDGTDDYLIAAFTVSQPWTRVSGIRQISWTASDRIFAEAAGSASGLLFQVGASPALALYDGSSSVPATSDLAVGTDGVVTEIHDGASSKIAINNGAYVTNNPGTTAPGGIAVGARPTGGNAGNFRFYAAAMCASAITDEEIMLCRILMAQRAGVTL